MVLDYIFFRHVLGLGKPVDTYNVESLLVQKTLTEQDLVKIIDESWDKTLCESADTCKWDGEYFLVSGKEGKILDFSYLLENYKEFNAVILLWNYPANGPLRAHETVFNHYFNLSIHEYLYK